MLKNIFKRNSSAKKQEEKKSIINWTPLTSLQQIEEIVDQSKEEAVLVFKHSTRCIISRTVLQQFEDSFPENFKNVKAYYLDLLNYREVSNEVGSRFQVLHQSPQLLVIKEGKAIADASHYDITQVVLKGFLKNN